MQVFADTTGLPLGLNVIYINTEATIGARTVSEMIQGYIVVTDAGRAAVNVLNSRWRKILRDVQKRKTQTVLVSASIFIGVLGVVTLFSMSEILVTALEGAVQQDKLAMIRTYVRLKGDDSAAGDLSALNTLPDIDARPGPVPPPGLLETSR